MPFTSDHPPRRNARSFDLDDSATKAAAWVWHLHESKPGVTTEGRFLSSQSRRRSSSSSDRKTSRFRQEAAESSSTRTKRGAMNFERPTWDCGSNLYDTFELVAFGNRLDRSLMHMEVVPLTPPAAPSLQAPVIIPHEHLTMSPLHERERERGGVLRTLSMPKSMKARKQSSKSKKANTAPADASKASLAKSRELSFSVFNQDQAPNRWPSMERLVKALKKVVVLHKQVSMNVGCKHSIQIVEPGQRPLKKPLSSDDSPSLHEFVGNNLSSTQAPTQRRMIKARRKSVDEELLNGRRRKDSIAEGGSKPRIPSQNYHKHLHHHHHHHHHYLHHTLASESARLSPETISHIGTEKSWVA